MNDEITICMVNYLDHNFVYMNYDNICNNNSNFKLILVNSLQSKDDCNNPKNQYYYDNYPLSNFNDKRVTIIDGVCRDEIIKELSLEKFLVGPASYYHGFNLNKALSHVKTRYLLLLDADFFIIRPFSEIIQYMQANNLCAYGAAGNKFDWCKPTPNQLVPNVPGARCMFLDTEKLPIQDLDFTPLLDKDERGEYYPDTGYKVSTKLLDIRYEVLNVCLDQHCEFCHVTWPNVFGKLKFLREVYYWKDNNELFGFHSRNTRTQKGTIQSELAEWLNPYLLFHSKFHLINNHPLINHYGSTI